MTLALPPVTLLIFLGTYTSEAKKSQGIYSVRLDAETGKLSDVAIAAKTPNPTFFSLRPQGDVFYALGEKGVRPDGKPAGALTVFSRKRDQLTPLNSEATGGGSATHIAVDATGRLAILVSYGTGEVSSFPLLRDGHAGPRTTFLKTSGKLGPNSTRQDKPHPHSTTLSPNNRFAYVCDLGLDTVFCYALHPENGTITAAGQFAAPAGVGPRHSKFSATGKFLYVINELGGSITVYSANAETGALTLLETVSTLSSNFSGGNTSAEICIHPNGNFVYGSNRGPDNITVFSRNEVSGKLARIQIMACGGKHPRNFALSPNGHWLVCANRDTNDVVSFRIDPKTGKLSEPVSSVMAPQVVCVLFAP